MKLTVIAVGHRMPSWINAGFEEYVKRMPRETPIVLREIKPETRHGEASAAATEKILQREAERIMKIKPKETLDIVLDERGKVCSTMELSRRFAQWREQGREVSFVIGSADGLAPAIRQQADWLWSLSPLTLPHGLVRVLLAEQLYRAASILGNHPYHRA